VHVHCTQLPEESSAQVEARLEASFLAREARGEISAEPNIDILCGSELAIVLVNHDEQSVALRVPLAGTALQERLIETAELALSELARKRVSADAAPTTAPVPVPPTPPTPKTSEPARTSALATPTPKALAAPRAAATPRAEVAPSDAAPTAEPRPAERSGEPRAQIRFDGIAELYDGVAALGGAAAFQYHVGQHWLGATNGLLHAEPDPSFETLEWYGALELGWKPEPIIASLSMGVSVLFVLPSAPIQSRNTATVVTPFGELRLGYPLTAGPLELIPAIGARAFTSARDVRLDGEPRFTLSGITPRFSLGVTYGSW
jgi:hypothetical protein